MKIATLPRRIFKDQVEPRSPKPMSNSIWDSTAKRTSSRHWSYRSHPRTPKVREHSPIVRFRMKPEKGFFIGTSENAFNTLDEVKAELKHLGYLRFHWMGKLTFVG